MSVSQNYGVLRVVRVRPPANAATDLQHKYPTGWLPEERLVHLLTRSETTIGRALNNDIILLDPTVSREHARLVWNRNGWRIFNLTLQNIVRVNGRPVPSGGSLVMRPQDFLVLGNTMLQLIAPQAEPMETQLLNASLTPLLEPTQRLAMSSRSGVSSDTSTPRRKEGQNGHERQRIQIGQEMIVFAPGSPSAGEAVVAASLPVQPEPELLAQPWEEGEENLLGAGVTMQFALPQRIGVRTRWLIAGVGIALLLISAIITIVLNSFIGLSALAQNGPSSILAALTIPLIPAVIIHFLVDFIDRFEREPWFLRLAAFLWGAIIAIPPALWIEQSVERILPLGPSTGNLLRTALQGLNAGITEETVKGLGLLLLFFVLRDEFDNVTDGIVYGALIGAGFAMVENFVYFAINPRDFIVFLIVGRIILGWLFHSTFTMCFGAALGYIRHTQVRWRQIVIPLLGYLIAVGLHSVFDFVDLFASAVVQDAPGNTSVALFSLIAVISDYIPPFVAQVGLLYVLMKSLAHEAAVIREFLADEVSNGIVRVGEYALLQNSFQRVREERRVLWKSGMKQWMRVRALYQTEIGLAFRKWHVSMGDKPKLGYRQPEDAYRLRIRRLRQEILQTDAKKSDNSKAPNSSSRAFE